MSRNSIGGPQPTSHRCTYGQSGIYVRFSGLSTPTRRRFGSLPLGVAEGRFATLAAEQEILPESTLAVLLKATQTPER
jgi:hypothetical protein